MTKETMKEKLVVMLDDSDIDTNVLSVYLDIAYQAVLNKIYPYDTTKTSVPTKYEYSVLEIACYLINKRGAEGEISHNENGVNRSYESASIPSSMLKDIVPYVGVL